VTWQYETLFMKGKVQIILYLILNRTGYQEYPLAQTLK
jgi:hypothetical protein